MHKHTSLLWHNRSVQRLCVQTHYVVGKKIFQQLDRELLPSHLRNEKDLLTQLIY